jgi:hypothetical protein
VEQGYGVRLWYKALVQGFGTRVKGLVKVQGFGTRIWYKGLVQGFGTRV